MSNVDWKLFNAAFDSLFAKLREQDERVEALESRACAAERRLRELEAETSRSTLALVGTAEECERIGTEVSR
jgi:hypothetical protein